MGGDDRNRAAVAHGPGAWEGAPLVSMSRGSVEKRRWNIEKSG